jgi:hypothetical protein
MIKLSRVQTPYIYIQDHLAGPSGSRATIPLFLTLASVDTVSPDEGITWKLIAHVSIIYLALSYRDYYLNTPCSSASKN